MHLQSSSHVTFSSHEPLQFNHSRWRGHVLRVEVAKPDFRSRQLLEQEEDVWNNEAWREEQAAIKAEEEQAGPSNKPLYFPIPGRKNKVWLV